MNCRLFTISFIVAFLGFRTAEASHIVGGEFSYVYLGDSTSGGTNYQKYKVSLSIYEDCLNGSPDAIAQDNPAFFGVFYMSGGGWLTYELDTFSAGPNAIFFTSSIDVPINFSNSCVANIPATCLLKKTFEKTYALPFNIHGYTIGYQRCCRNASIVNVFDPSNTGSTFFCTLPPSTTYNNSAVFKNYPPQIICLNNPLNYDNSATDADGDSLSYGFYAPLDGADNSMTSKPPPSPPPYNDSVLYVTPWSSQVPMTGSPAIHINPSTGLITGSPNLVGRYLVGVYCEEWRDGAIINVDRREFQFVVTPCTKTVVADIPQFSTDYNTYIVDCSDYTVNFVNTSTGGFSYAWDFGVPGAAGDTSNEFEPTFTYPDTGTYTVKLVVNPGSTCPDSISRFVKVYPKFLAAFSDSGKQCPGATINFTDLTSSTMKPITFWKWNFGDGDSSSLENPVHSFSSGGTYNVTLISENVKDCIDTALVQVVIESFKAFAGDDTVIVKGSSILFDATGGITYAWTPSTNLNDTAVYDPLGTYPDTGMFTYYVHVTSDYGCSGYDSIKVRVVNNAEFIVPNAFTPNGDGKNDYFRPIAVGYSGLKYFRVFNRWGEMIYNSTSFETGWDGTYKNVKADIGTYFWELKYIDRFGNEGSMKGDVTLMR